MKTIYNETPGKDFTLSEKINIACEKLEDWRILLLAGFVLFQGCVIVPALLLVSSFNDIGLTGPSVLISALGTVAILVSNMAEARIKIILFVFITNLILSIALIGIHVIL